MLESNNKIKTYQLGIVAPRTFNDITVLHDILAEKLAHISHITTNNVVEGGETIRKYAQQIGIPYTIYPISPQVGGVLISNFNIVQNSDFIIILHDGESKNTDNVKTECEKRDKKYKIVDFIPLPTRQSDILKIQNLIRDKLGEILQSGDATDTKFLNKLLKATE